MWKVLGIILLASFLPFHYPAAQQSLSAADSLFREGKKLQKAYQYLASNQLFEASSRLFDGQSDHCMAVRANIQIAYNFLDHGLDQEALIHIEKLSDNFAARLCQDSLVLGDLYIACYNIYAAVRNIDLSRKTLESALTLSESLGLKGQELKARVLNNYASFYGTRGANYQALNAAEESMNWKRKNLPAKDRRYLNGLYAIANYSERTGDYERAYLCLDSLIQIAASVEDYSLSSTYHLLSLVCLRKREYEVAKKYALLAIDLFAKEYGPQSRVVSYGHQELASAYLGLDQPQVAREHYQKAFDLRNKYYGPYHRLTLSSLSSLTKTEMVLGDTLNSIEKYKEIVDHFKREYQVSNAEKYALNTITIGELYQGIGEIDSAQSYFQRALEIANEYYQDGDRIHSEVHLALSKVGNFQSRHRHTIRAIFHLLGDTSLQEVNGHKLALAKDKYAVLRLFHQHSQNLYQQYLSADSLCYLDDLLALEDQYKTIKDEIFGQFLSPQSIVKAAPLIREISLTRLLAASELYIKKSKPQYLDAALRAMHDSKNLSLQTQLHEKNFKKIFDLSDTLLRQEEELYLQINQLTTEIIERDDPKIESKKLELEKKYFDVRRRIFLHSSRYGRFLGSEVPTISEIQAHLDDKSIILNYFLDRGTLFILCITKSTAKLSQLPFGSNELTKLSNFIRWAQGQGTDAGNKNLMLGHDLFVTLVPKDLPNQLTRLIIIPDNDLSTVPFDLLMTSAPNTQMPFSELPYLLRKYEIIYLSGLQNYLTDHKINTKRAVAFAPFVPGVNPDIISLPLLKHTDHEIQIIEDLFHLKKFRGVEATEEQFKRLDESLSILHIASHAIIDNQDPLQSNILFYPQQNAFEDGQLRLWELYSMEIPANLAVLSACQTSDGKVINGSGLVNIARGFYTAGTQTVVSNLWPVQDYAASQMMRSFYTQLDRSVQPAAALRQAKLDYLASEEGPLLHPRFWAGWVIQRSSLPTDHRHSIGSHLKATLLALFLLMAAFIYHRWSRHVSTSNIERADDKHLP